MYIILVGYVQAQTVSGFVVVKMTSTYFGIPCQSSFHLCPHPISILSSIFSRHDQAAKYHFTPQ
jgi:hypothetical protein